MGGLRKPLLNAPFLVGAWTYFNASKLVAAVEFGWDISFMFPPNPVDTHYNLQSTDEDPDNVN